MLRFLAIVRLALRNLVVHKMRTFLTTLGIMIGVSAVIAMVALGQGTKDQMLTEMRKFGSDVVVLRPEYRSAGGVTSGNFTRISLEDCDALMEQVPQLSGFSPEVEKRMQAKFGAGNQPANVKGVSLDFLEMRNYEVAAGRNFHGDEVDASRKVALVGHKVVVDLFGGDAARAVGEEIKLDGTAYRVIGALAEKGDSGWFNPDDVILVPYTTAMSRITGVRDLYMANFKVSDERYADDAIRGITRVMRKRRGLAPGTEDDFRVQSAREAIQGISNVMNAFTLLISGIAGISLMVGGIGIMNIMLVTVTERTREIGIRKALGAKRRDIMQQFLVEAVVISLTGGLLGVAVGVGVSALSGALGVVAAPVSWVSVLVSLLFCFFIGTFFGIYPARKAARLDPIEALRYE